MYLFADEKRGGRQNRKALFRTFSLTPHSFERSLLGVDPVDPVRAARSSVKLESPLLSAATFGPRVSGCRGPAVATRRRTPLAAQTFAEGEQARPKTAATTSSSPMTTAQIPISHSRASAVMPGQTSAVTPNRMASAPRRARPTSTG
jgi:hypothetical protein